MRCFTVRTLILHLRTTSGRRRVTVPDRWISTVEELTVGGKKGPREGNVMALKMEDLDMECGVPPNQWALLLIVLQATGHHRKVIIDWYVRCCRDGRIRPAYGYYL